MPTPRPAASLGLGAIPGASENSDPIPADVLAAPTVEKTRPPLPSLSIAERSRQDPSFLDLDPKTLDPSRHYRWVRCRKDEHHLAVISSKLEGYTIEMWRDGGPRPMVDTEKRPDGIISVGDLILMSCTRVNNEVRQEEQYQRREALLATTSAQTLEMAKEKGIVTIKDPDHN